MNSNKHQNENSIEKNYYWQSFFISFILIIGINFLLVSFGIYKDELSSIGSFFFILIVYLVNVVLKKVAKKYGDDILK